MMIFDPLFCTLMSCNFLLLDVEEIKSSSTVVKEIDEVRVIDIGLKCSRLLTIYGI